MYGKQLIIDLYNCDIKTFTVKSIKKYFKELCDVIDMTPEAQHFYEHPEGEITAVQFIITSHISVHVVSKFEEAHIDIFSCKDFNPFNAKNFTAAHFKTVTNIHDKLIIRGKNSTADKCRTCKKHPCCGFRRNQCGSYGKSAKETLEFCDDCIHDSLGDCKDKSKESK